MCNIMNNAINPVYKNASEPIKRLVDYTLNDARDTSDTREMSKVKKTG